MRIVPGCGRRDGFSVDLRIKPVVSENQAWQLDLLRTAVGFASGLLALGPSPRRESGGRTRPRRTGRSARGKASLDLLGD